ncbi:MAG: DUF1768 domain-containing protein [Clostridia bacterium]|nr:DUF1768 domain-containing protein [Clostridia bacterium]
MEYMSGMKKYNPVLDGMLGLAVGDALGVPYEFLSRKEMKQNPARDMIGYGTYNQPEGSWSDDTSMALCTADSLVKRFDPEDMMKKFSAWKTRQQYTATGVRFDIGITSRKAIEKHEMGLDASECGDDSEYGNGNGALMRIFPVSIMQCLKMTYSPENAGEFLSLVHRTAALTHAHERGLICCGIYTLILNAWINKAEKDSLLDVFARGFEQARDAYVQMGGKFKAEIEEKGRFIHPGELALYDEERIESSGYVLHTLHAALWCLLTTDSYEQCVLKAVNLGEDTDTTAAVAGSLAGVIYGRAAIPASWLEKLKNINLIAKISNALDKALLGDQEEENRIDSFTKEYAHMALKADCRFVFEGVEYRNAAAAYLAQSVEAEYRAEFSMLNAHQARRLAKQLPAQADWDDEKKEKTLYDVCLQKYKQNGKLAEKLVSTGEREIIYDTTGAHDNEMGRCACDRCKEYQARNLYGNVLMRVRRALMQESACLNEIN